MYIYSRESCISFIIFITFYSMVYNYVGLLSCHLLYSLLFEICSDDFQKCLHMIGTNIPQHTYYGRSYDI